MFFPVGGLASRYPDCGGPGGTTANGQFDYSQCGSRAFARCHREACTGHTGGEEPPPPPLPPPSLVAVASTSAPCPALDAPAPAPIIGGGGGGGKGRRLLMPAAVPTTAAASSSTAVGATAASNQSARHDVNTAPHPSARSCEMIAMREQELEALLTARDQELALRDEALAERDQELAAALARVAELEAR